MPLPYPTKVVLPFDIATAQDMNERHANDVALANGSGLGDGAVTPEKRSGGFASGTMTVSATGTQAVSGLDFAPKFVRITVASISSGAIVATSTAVFDGTDTRGMSMAVRGSYQDIKSDDGEVGRISITSGGAVSWSSLIEPQSLESDGFTYNVTVANASDKYFYEAYG